MLIGILANFCDCLTDVKYNFNPAIGREKELEELMITILTPGKSALLIGKPGVGKTAILEGLAYNIQKDNVPKVLKDFVIYKTSAATLNNNCVYNGMLEKNVLDLFNALEYRKDTILFIDEIHTLVGTGKSISHDTLDIANIIKPFITSENIHLIGATTDYEYEYYIKGDPAFSRRFSNIIIEEPKDYTLENILYYTIDKYSKMYNIKVDKNLALNVSKSISKYTRVEYRNPDSIGYNPDLSINIIAKAFGYARLYDKHSIEESDFIRAYNNMDRVNGNFHIFNSSKFSSNIIDAKFRFKHS